MTTVTLRPNAERFRQGIGTVGSTDAAAVLADNSDASYAIVDGATSDTLQVELTTSAIPAGARLKTLTNRIRALAGIDVSGLAGRVHAWIWLPAGPSPQPTMVAAGLVVPPTGAAGTITVGSFAIPHTATQAHIDGMYHVLLSPTEGPAVPVQVYEVYVDVTYATQPVATIATPTPSQVFTDTSRPAARWSHAAGSDGGPQAWYEVRVYSQAQYSAPGFNAETAAAIWPHPSDRTGGSFDAPTHARPGSETEVQLGPLANDTTYRVYVRTAQTINGQPHWSAWDFETFSIDVTPAVVGSVTVTAQPDLARLEIVAARAGGVAWQGIDVERNDNPAGVPVWVPVRGGTERDATGNVNLFTIYDYDVPNGADAQYRVRAILIEPSSGEWVVGEWTYSAVAGWVSPLEWFKSPHHPELNAPIRVRAHEDEYPIVQGVFKEVDSTYPIVVSATRQATVGTMTLVTETDAELAAVRTLFRAQPNVLLWHPPDGWGIDGNARYIEPGALRESRIVQYGVRTERFWQFPYVEVAAPPDLTAAEEWGEAAAGTNDLTTTARITVGVRVGASPLGAAPADALTLDQAAHFMFGSPYRSNGMTRSGLVIGAPPFGANEDNLFGINQGFDWEEGARTGQAVVQYTVTPWAHLFVGGSGSAEYEVRVQARKVKGYFLLANDTWQLMTAADPNTLPIAGTFYDGNFASSANVTDAERGFQTEGSGGHSARLFTMGTKPDRKLFHWWYNGPYYPRIAVPTGCKAIYVEMQARLIPDLALDPGVNVDNTNFLLAFGADRYQAPDTYAGDFFIPRAYRLRSYWRWFGGYCYGTPWAPSGTFQASLVNDSQLRANPPPLGV
jgi:hypothetical protein